jgi:LysM repeat protein
MAYNFYLDGMHLPIAPSDMAIKIKNQNRTITLINEGEVNVLKTPGLTDIAFDIMVPQTKLPFATYPGGFRGADFYLGRLERLKTSQSPFQFIVSRILPSGKSLFDTNIRVSLEDYEIRENANEGFDLIIAVKLKQYRSYGAKTITINPPTVATEKPIAQATSDRASERQGEGSYTVVEGDCLWNIAKKHYGSGRNYEEIYNLNKDKISNPNLIFPGQVLIMP